MHVRKGDQVVVISGKEKGKRGRVLRLLTAKNRVVIERVNMVKRHTRPTQRSPRGGIVEKEAGLPLANVLLWCGRCAAPRRAKYPEAVAGSKMTMEERRRKRRICVKCGVAFEAA